MAKYFAWSAHSHVEGDGPWSEQTRSVDTESALGESLSKWISKGELYLNLLSTDDFFGNLIKKFELQVKIIYERRNIGLSNAFFIF